MSVRDNIAGILKSLDIRSKEASIGKSIVKTSTVESVFLTEYESFKVNLYKLLEKYMTFESAKSVIVRPKDTNVSKFLRYMQEDSSMNGLYKIVQKAGGEFEFLQGASLEDVFLGEEESVDEDENVFYI